MWQPSGRQRAVDGPPKTEDFAFCGDFAFCRMTRVLEGGAIGLDLGKRQEYTALTAAAEREEWEQYRRTFEDRAQTQMARRRVLSERWLQHL